jgi:hypothetical protein
MALTWIEDGDSRQATIVRKGKKATSSYVRSYKVFGTTDDVVLHADISSKIQNTLTYWQYPGLPEMKLLAEQYTVSYLGDDAWQVTIQYEKAGAEDGTDPLKRSRSFDTTGGTQHITQSMRTSVTYDSAMFGSITILQAEKRFPQDAADMSGAIGVDGNGVNGVDVVSPQLQWQENYDVPNVYVTSAYIRGVASITGTTNSASFRGFEAGEVLFVGCSGNQEWDDQKGRGPWSLSYRFIASKNITGDQIGSITGIEKKGHEYLWVRYEDAVDSNVLLKKPKAVYVNKVYRESNFSALGIGTT